MCVRMNGAGKLCRTGLNGERERIARQMVGNANLIRSAWVPVHFSWARPPARAPPLARAYAARRGKCARLPFFILVWIVQGVIPSPWQIKDVTPRGEITGESFYFSYL